MVISGPIKPENFFFKVERNTIIVFWGTNLNQVVLDITLLKFIKYAPSKI